MNQQEKELLLKDLLHSVAYGVKINWTDSNETMGVTFESETDYENNLYPLPTLVFTLEGPSDPGWKPIKFPISAITQEITVNGETFVPIDYFEVTDDFQTCPIEQDNGNVKLIRDLTAIAKNNVIFDTQFLPMWVIDKLRSWHINTSLPDHLFVPVTETFNPYAL